MAKKSNEADIKGFKGSRACVWNPLVVMKRFSLDPLAKEFVSKRGSLNPLAEEFVPKGAGAEPENNTAEFFIIQPYYFFPEFIYVWDFVYGCYIEYKIGAIFI